MLPICVMSETKETLVSSYLYQNSCFVFSYIARTESAITDMSYIINHHLSKKGDPVKTHSTGSEGLHYTTMDLPFFSALDNPQELIDKLKPFHDDFALFGYNYKIDSTGKVTGSCDNILNGMCC